MSDKVVSLIRTAVPVVWGSVIAWLLTVAPLDPEVTAVLRGFDEALVAVVIAAFYAAARWAEPHLPDWLTVVLLGSAREPRYVGKHVAA